jgi:putative ABC transport system ATP-binding protein
MTVPAPQHDTRDITAKAPLIELRHCSQWYPSGGGKTFVLQDVSVTIAGGEFASIMGPSGAGKSTLLHILGLLDSPADGQHFFLGQEVTALKEKQRAEIYKLNIGFVFQSYHLIDELTVYENLETPLLYKSVPVSERKALVADVLDRFNIVGKKDLFPAQLSGGQQQLVGIARAVISSPKLILADEPTGNLNSAQGEEIMEIFRRLNDEGTTIVQVTHSEKNAAYGSRVIELIDGRVVRP